MKKKNVLTMALSVSLVGVIAVGGTLAYLSGRTEKVSNTFTFDDSITIDLKEHKSDKWSDETKDWIGDASEWNDPNTWVKANRYEDVVPGQVIHKDPTVKFDSVPANGANLYVSVSGLSNDLTSNMDIWTVVDENGGWKKIANMDGTTDMDGTANGIYLYVDKDGSPKEITSVGTVPVFGTVTVSSAVSTHLNDATVEIKAYSVQATGSLGVEESRDQLAINTLKVGD